VTLDDFEGTSTVGYASDSWASYLLISFWGN